MWGQPDVDGHPDPNPDPRQRNPQAKTASQLAREMTGFCGQHMQCASGPTNSPVIGDKRKSTTDRQHGGRGSRNRSPGRILCHRVRTQPISGGCESGDTNMTRTDRIVLSIWWGVIAVVAVYLSH